MPDKKSKLARLRHDIDSATQSRSPRGCPGDIEVIIIHNDAEYAAAKQAVLDRDPAATLVAILDFHE